MRPLAQYEDIMWTGMKHATYLHLARLDVISVTFIHRQGAHNTLNGTRIFRIRGRTGIELGLFASLHFRSAAARIATSSIKGMSEPAFMSSTAGKR
jgi:hypothetical protein